MSQELLRPLYAEHVGTRFRVQREGASPLELEFLNLTDFPSPPTQEQFTLLFRGPLDAPLAQQTYTLEHEQMDTTDMMLVPVGRDQTGLYYEAVFNRLLG